MRRRLPFVQSQPIAHEIPRYGGSFAQVSQGIESIEVKPVDERRVPLHTPRRFDAFASIHTPSLQHVQRAVDVRFYLSRHLDPINAGEIPGDGRQ